MQQIYRRTPKLKCDFHVDAKATSKTSIRTLDPDPDIPAPLKTWTLTNMDPKKTWTLKNMNSEKYGVNMGGVKNISDFSELCFINKDHALCDLLFKSSQISKLIFQAKSSSYNNSSVNWKSWKHQECFMFYRFYAS